MTNFRLNVPKLNSEIADYKKIKNSCLIELDSVYESLSYTDSAWNDFNSGKFIETIKKDSYKINCYFDDLDLLYREIEDFKDKIGDLTAKYGYSSSPNIKFNDDYYNACSRHFRNAINYISNAQYYLNNCSFPSDFTAMYYVYTLRNELYNLKKSINNLWNTVYNFKSSVNSIISDSRSAVTKHSDLELNIELIEYNWKAVEPTVVKHVSDEPRMSINSSSNIDVKNVINSHINSISGVDSSSNVFVNNNKEVELNSINGVNMGVATGANNVSNLSEDISIKNSYSSTENAFINSGKDVELDSVNGVSMADPTIKNSVSELSENTSISNNYSSTSNVFINNIKEDKLDSLTSIQYEEGIRDINTVFSNELNDVSNFNSNNEIKNNLILDSSYDLSNNTNTISSANTNINVSEIKNATVDGINSYETGSSNVSLTSEVSNNLSLDANIETFELDGSKTKVSSVNTNSNIDSINAFDSIDDITNK